MWQLTNTNYGTSGYPGSGGLINTKLYDFAPKDSYWVWQVISTAVVPDSIVFHNSCTEVGSGGTLRVAACESPSGEQTVMVYNLDLTQRANFRIAYLGPSTRFASLSPQRLARRLVDPAHLPTGLIKPDKTVRIETDFFDDDVPPGSFAVYRTLLASEGA
jgi:hypothetical protein